MRLRVVRIVLARVFALIPRRFRFAAARRIALAGAPIAWRFAPREWRDLNSGTDIALWSIVRAMNPERIEFDFQIAVEGTEILDEARAAGRGLLLISGHFRLNLLAIRWLHDRGWTVFGVRQDADQRHYIAGTGKTQVSFKVTPRVLLQVRRALAAGHIVIVQADSSDPVAHGFTIGDLHISDAAPRAAARWNTTMAYLETRTDSRGHVHAKITRGAAGDLRRVFEGWLAK